MMKKKRPTRAEAGDVANAVLDGCCGLILTRETAIGDFPVHAVETMKKICIEAERCIDYSMVYNSIKSLDMNNNYLTASQALAASAVGLSFQINASVIILITNVDTSLISLVSKYAPKALLLVVSDNI